MIEPTLLGSNTGTTVSKLCCTDVTIQGVKGFDLVCNTLHLSSAKAKSQMRYSVIFLLHFYQNKNSYLPEGPPNKADRV